MSGLTKPGGVSETGLEMFDAAPVAVAVSSGPDHKLIYANGVYRAIFGNRPLGVPISESFKDVQDLDRYLGLYDHVLETGESVTVSDAPLEMAYAEPGPADTTERSFSIGLSRFEPIGADPGVLIIALEVTDRVLQAERIKQLAEGKRRLTARYRTLGKMGSQMVVVTDAQGYVVEELPGWEVVTGQSFEEVRGAGWLQMIHPDDRAGALEVWRRSLADEVPSVWEQVLRIRTVDGPYRHFSTRSVPVFDRGKLVEWIGVCTDIEDELADQRRDRLVDRAAAATSGIAQPDEMLAALSGVIVTALADSCRVYVVREDPHRSPADPFVIDPVSTTIAAGLPSMADRGAEGRSPQTMLGRAIVQRQPTYRTFPMGHPPRDVGPESVHAWLSAAEANSLVCIPIIVDGTVAAAAVVSTCGDRPAPSAADVSLMTQIFEHAHDALSSAIAFRRTQQIALAMQHSLLTDPPRVPGLSIAARYQPATTGVEVGGDWYDCFLLPDQATVLSIGDVAGHDLAAAVTMGQIRTILRGLAVDRRESSGGILRRLNTAIEALYGDNTATCILASIEQDGDGRATLDYAVAGHPPPLLVTSDGQSRFLEGHRNQLLGTPGDQEYEHSVEPLPPGCTLLLYTDGLVEHPDEDLDRGLERLRQMAGTFATKPVEDFCDELLGDLPITGDDDIAMIAVRLPMG